jgi:hypothetical protein
MRAIRDLRGQTLYPAIGTAIGQALPTPSFENP